jgi:uncharacterized protein YukE
MAGQIRISPEQIRSRAGEVKAEGENFQQLIDDIGARLDGTANAIKQLNQNIAQKFTI